MRVARFAAIGIALQVMLFAAFILVARAGAPHAGKLAVIIFAALCMLGLLVRAARGLSIGKLAAVCALWAIGYTLGFHVMGALFFPSLLKDVEGWSTDYTLSIARVAGTLFAMYLVAALAIHGFRVVIGRLRTSSE